MSKYMLPNLTYIIFVLLKFSRPNSDAQADKIQLKHPGTLEEQDIVDQVNPTSANRLTLHWSHDTDAGSWFAHASCL